MTTIPELTDHLVDVHAESNVDTDVYTLVLTYDSRSHRDHARRLFGRGMVENMTDDELARALNHAGLAQFAHDAIVGEQLDRLARTKRRGPWRVICEDGVVRHDGDFATRYDAEVWADQGHVCTRNHTYTSLNPTLNNEGQQQS